MSAKTLDTETLSDSQKAVLRRVGEMPGENKSIILHKPFFKNLNNNEFKVFWSLPLDVLVDKRTQKYIEKRRLLLRLEFTDTSGFNLRKRKKDEKN